MRAIKLYFAPMKKGYRWTVEQRAKLLGNQNAKGNRARTGRPHTAKTRAKMSVAHRGNRSALTSSVKGECVYCLAPGTSYDHVIPRGRVCGCDRGMPIRRCTAPENLAPACRNCNRWKGNRTPEEWFAQDAITSP